MGLDGYPVAVVIAVACCQRQVAGLEGMGVDGAQGAVIVAQQGVLAVLVHQGGTVPGDLAEAAAVVGATTFLASPVGIVSTVGTLALLAGGGILLSKIARK